MLLHCVNDLLLTGAVGSFDRDEARVIDVDVELLTDGVLDVDVYGCAVEFNFHGYHRFCRDFV